MNSLRHSAILKEYYVDYVCSLFVEEDVEGRSIEMAFRANIKRLAMCVCTIEWERKKKTKE